MQFFWQIRMMVLFLRVQTSTSLTILLTTSNFIILQEHQDNRSPTIHLNLSPHHIWKVTFEAAQPPFPKKYLLQLLNVQLLNLNHARQYELHPNQTSETSVHYIN
jgi:hypothetical protein